MIAGVFWVLDNGAKWKDLPSRFGPKSTVHRWFRKWVNADGGVMVSITVFQDKASADESNRKVADYLLQNLMSMLPHPPQVTAGEVVAYKTA